MRRLDFEEGERRLWIPITEEERRRRQEEEWQRNRVDWLDAIGLPVTLRQFTFTMAERTLPIDLTEAFHKSDGVKLGRALVLLGPTGVGKSVAGAALIDANLADLRTSILYKNGLTLVRELHSFDSADEAMKSCTRVRSLMLDDLPSIGDNRVAQMVEEILVTREAKRLATMILSNIIPAQLSTIFSDRVRDRLRSWGKIHTIPGPSLRREPEAKA